MTNSQRMRSVKKSGVKKKPAEELNVLNGELANLKRQLTGCADGRSDEEFDDLIDRFDVTQARIGVLEKQIERDGRKSQKKARRKK